MRMKIQASYIFRSGNVNLGIGLQCDLTSLPLLNGEKFCDLFCIIFSSSKESCSDQLYLPHSSLEQGFNEGFGECVPAPPCE